jgi:hypothetical protein
MILYVSINDIDLYLLLDIFRDFIYCFFEILDKLFETSIVFSKSRTLFEIELFSKSSFSKSSFSKSRTLFEIELFSKSSFSKSSFSKSRTLFEIELFRTLFEIYFSNRTFRNLEHFSKIIVSII